MQVKVIFLCSYEIKPCLCAHQAQNAIVVLCLNQIHTVHISNCNVTFAAEGRVRSNHDRQEGVGGSVEGPSSSKRPSGESRPASRRGSGRLSSQRCLAGVQMLSGCAALANSCLLSCSIAWMITCVVGGSVLHSVSCIHYLW
jgi:hypothetical protein